MTPYYSRAVRDLDKACDLDSDSGKAAALMLAALKHGSRQIRELARVTGVPPKEAFPIARRLRSNGVWRNGKTYGDWSGESGGIAFWMDVCIGVGWMNRVRGSSNGGEQHGAP